MYFLTSTVVGFSYANSVFQKCKIFVFANWGSSALAHSQNSWQIFLSSALVHLCRCGGSCFYSLPCSAVKKVAHSYQSICGHRWTEAHTHTFHCPVSFENTLYFFLFTFFIFLLYQELQLKERAHQERQIERSDSNGDKWLCLLGWWPADVAVAAAGNDVVPLSFFFFCWCLHCMAAHLPSPLMSLFCLCTTRFDVVHTVHAAELQNVVQTR